MTTQDRKALYDNAVTVVIKSAFEALKAKGYTCKTNYMCCGSCAHAHLSGHEKYVFWTKQDRDMGEQKAELWLKWKGDGQEIVDTLRTHSAFSPVKVEWGGLDTWGIRVYASTK
jgi:hypothetical protein